MYEDDADWAEIRYEAHHVLILLPNEAHLAVKTWGKHRCTDAFSSLQQEELLLRYFKRVYRAKYPSKAHAAEDVDLQHKN